MGYRLKPFTMSVRNNSTQEFEDIGLLRFDVEGEIRELQENLDSLEQKIDWFVTPEMFGAVGDGVTDDTAALAACFATGKIVVLRATYAVSSMLTYAGSYIFGGGIIKVLSLQAGVRSPLHITSSSCKVENIEIDCNNTAALGLWVTTTKNISIKNCYIHDTETAYYDGDMSSCGIAIDNSESAEVCHCVIENINRSSGVDGTHGSTGVVVYATKTIRVYNNVINGVKSSTGLADCDGIYVTQVHDNVDNTEAIVENNRIIDCTGRFVKSQTAYTVVRNNFCVLTYTFVPNDKYFNCVSIQRGSFEIVNNYFDVNESIHRSYSRMFSLEIHNTIPRSGIIKGNTIVGIKSSQSNRWIRSYLTIVCTVENARIDIDMSDNNFTGYSEDIVEIATNYNLSGSIKVHHNTTYAYQVLDMLSGSVNNLGDVLLDVRYNDNTLQTSSTRFSDTSTLFKNLIYRYNRGIDETLNNYPLSYNDLVTFEGYYRGASQMTDMPSVIGRGDYLYLNKSAKVCEFYCGGNGNHGYIV